MAKEDKHFQMKSEQP